MLPGKKGKGEKETVKPMEEQGQPSHEGKKLGVESGLCRSLWNPGQLPALLELRYGLQILLGAHLSPGGNLLNTRPSDSRHFCDPPSTSCLAILGIKTLLQKYLFTGPALIFFFPPLI